MFVEGRGGQWEADHWEWASFYLHLQPQLASQETSPGNWPWARQGLYRRG